MNFSQDLYVIEMINQRKLESCQFLGFFFFSHVQSNLC